MILSALPFYLILLNISSAFNMHFTVLIIVLYLHLFIPFSQSYTEHNFTVNPYSIHYVYNELSLPYVQYLLRVNSTDLTTVYLMPESNLKRYNDMIYHGVKSDILTIEYDTVNSCATKEEFRYENEGKFCEKGNGPVGSSRTADTNENLLLYT